MPTRSLVLAALLMGFGFANGQIAQGGMVAQSGVFVTSSNFGPPLVLSFTTSDEDDVFASAKNNIDAPGAFHSSANGTASAGFGHLSLFAEAQANGAFDATGYAAAAVSVSASWSDTMVVNSASHQPGRALVVRTSYLLVGSAFVNAVNGDSQAELSIAVDGLNYLLRSDDDTRSIPPPIIAFTVDVLNGQSRTLSSRMSMSAIAGTSASLGNATASGFYGNSLHWGGIQSVEDALTGEVLRDWTITSGSGTDYSRPIGFGTSPVPEPSRLILLATALAGVLPVRRLLESKTNWRRTRPSL